MVLCTCDMIKLSDVHDRVMLYTSVCSVATVRKSRRHQWQRGFIRDIHACMHVRVTTH